MKTKSKQEAGYMNRVFLDTNSLIDILIDENNSKEYDKIRGSADNIKNSRVVIEEYLEQGYTLVVNTTSITNTTYFLQDRQKIATDIVIDKISMIEEDEDLFLVVLETKQIRQKAREYARENDADYEDALQYFCAKESGCDTIITNDKNFPKLDIRLTRTNKNLENYYPNTIK